MFCWKVRLILVWFSIAFGMASLSEIHACKYSVRDVGFVDLGSAPYQLCICTDSKTSAAWRRLVEEAVAEQLVDTNIVARWVDIERQNIEEGVDSESIAFLRERNVADYPTAVLVSPDGQRNHVPLPESDAARLQSKLKSLVTSSVREQLLQRCLSHHSVVLLLEGAGTKQNRAARDIAEGAIAQIEAAMDTLPKPIDQPPVLVVVSADQARQDPVLLWSLGITQDQSAETHLIALFGRGRMMGAPLTLPDATTGQLVHRLYYVGQDCECELDRAVMQGTMIPHRWDTQSEAAAVKQLGFDPGNPLVQAEIRRILTRGPDSGRLNREIGFPAMDDALGGYQEIEINPLGDQAIGEDGSTPDVIDASIPALTKTPTAEADVPDSNVPEAAVQSDRVSTASKSSVPIDESENRAMWITGAVGGAVVVVALLCGVWVLLRANRGQ